MPEDVVITGIGVISSIGCDERRFWDSLCQGRTGASAVVGLDTSELTRKIACQIHEPIDVEPELGRASQLAVAATRQAVSGAGLILPDRNGKRFSVVVGTTMGETGFIEERLTAPSDEWLSTQHLTRIRTGRPGSIGENIRTDLVLNGPAVDLYGACAAGNMAIATGRQQLLSRRCDVALVGGADGFSLLAFIGFMRLRVMAAGVCRPFDIERDGLLVGEGAAMFVLERESSARRRGAPIRARVSGCGIACETHHPTRPDPQGDGLTRAVRAALRDADIDPGTIDYVCSHGTGTPHNDAIEASVLERCFPDGVAFSSIKALTGHPMGAAAALEAVCCVLSLEHQTLIPTWNLEHVLQPCSADAIQGRVRKTRVRHVLNNSAGFGGYNSSVVLSAA